MIPRSFEKKVFGRKKNFLEAVNQLKKTSDCIKIDPPGPEQNLEKKSQKNEKMTHVFCIFCVFIIKARVFS